MKSELLSFWDHIDVLRKALFRILIAITLFAVAAFCFKEPLFEMVLAPRNLDFITFRLLDQLAAYFSLSFLHFQNTDVQIISTQLTAQFMIHIKVSCYVAAVAASPYIIYQIFRFVSPALYQKERLWALRLIPAFFGLFFIGVLLSYFIIFPFSFRFLANYQVDTSVQNLFNLNSYMDTFLLLTLLLGIVFEIPVMAWFLSKFGLIKPALMKKYRKYAIVIVLIVAAIITPTTDIFTLLLVTLPILLLYELSILIVKKQYRYNIKKN
ncbi:MAG: twin-arginine translocase subunit TatC [Bacteroidales bacterium]|jgi:sec-independent protein translocase protein TatC|nr:twin-arginine translocase subunit TatC [Bacteroidales bacterium]